MQSTNNLTVLILAAGYGRRMGSFSRMVNKSLIPYNNKPLISHIIERFDVGTKFVVACGHNSQQVKDYVGAVHTDKNIVFVDIENYNEANTGPATTIQLCQEHIKGGFMWVACDTLFDFDYKDKLDHNWIAVHPVDSSISQDYCWIERNGDTITRIENKVRNKNAVDAFIGLMYCKDDQYINNLIERNATETPQGFEGLELKAHTVHKWKDFGTYEKWEELNNEFDDVSFPKPNEIFYSDNKKIIKYFTHASSVDLRVIRAEANPKCMPLNIRTAGNFLVHDYANGDIMYNQYTPALFKKMLNWCETQLWVNAPEVDIKTVLHRTNQFYHSKTIERLEQFRIKYSGWSECCKVNGFEVDSIDNYLKKIDWNWLCEKSVWKFIHGDLHFDNTIYDPLTDKFTAIDWRTDFAGELYGDLYYDLAKMLGGIWLSYLAVKENKLTYIDNADHATLTIPSINDAFIYEEILQDWVVAHNLDWRKVKTLVPIIYLNMSPLHEAPFDKFLIALAQLHFSKVL